MKRRAMFIAVAAVLMLVGSSGFSPAHAAGTATTQPGSQITKLKAALEQINLTAVQKKQIRQIISTYHKTTGTAGNTTTGTSGTANGTASGSHKQMLKEILAVLTPNQKIKLVQLLKAGKAAK